MSRVLVYFHEKYMAPSGGPSGYLYNLKNYLAASKGEPENAAKAREKKHMTFTEAADIARKAGPKQMWLTHYSPSLIKPDEFMPAVRKIFPDSHPGKDGKTITLTFENEDTKEKSSS